MPKGGASFTTISVNQSISNPGRVKWDGKYLAIAGFTDLIYRFKISGHGGTKMGTVHIDGSSRVVAFWIQSRGVYVPGSFAKRKDAVRLYAYPAGGAPLKSFIGFSAPFGATVSIAK